MTTPPLNALRAFEAVARLGSFRAAAEVLFVTQSAVSHQIRNVEEALGRPLFERQGNRTVLLPHGAELARRLSAALSEIQSACEQAQDAERALVIAAIPSVAICWLIPRLSRFRAAHPEIGIRIVYAFHGQEISTEDVHLAFVYGATSPVPQHLRAETFLPGSSVPVCSPAALHRLGRPPVTARDYCTLGLLHDCTSAGWTAWLAGAPGPAVPEQAMGGTCFEDFNLLRAAALSGQGVALCPPAMIGPDLGSGALMQLSDRHLDAGNQYYLLSATGLPPRQQQRVLLFRAWAMAERDAGP